MAKRKPTYRPRQSELSVQDVRDYSTPEGAASANEEMRRLRLAIDNLRNEIPATIADNVQPAALIPESPAGTTTTNLGDTNTIINQFGEPFALSVRHQIEGAANGLTSKVFRVAQALTLSEYGDYDDPTIALYNYPIFWEIWPTGLADKYKSTTTTDWKNATIRATTRMPLHLFDVRNIGSGHGLSQGNDILQNSPTSPYLKIAELRSLVAGTGITISSTPAELTISSTAESLPSGTEDDTLRYGASGWEANSAFQNHGNSLSLILDPATDGESRGFYINATAVPNGTPAVVLRSHNAAVSQKLLDIDGVSTGLSQYDTVSVDDAWTTLKVNMTALGALRCQNLSTHQYSISSEFLSSAGNNVVIGNATYVAPYASGTNVYGTFLITRIGSTPKHWLDHDGNITAVGLAGSGDRNVIVDSTGKLKTGTGTGSGSTTFLGLTDTPASYSSQATKMIVVNAGETALEFVDQPTGVQYWDEYRNVGNYAYWTPSDASANVSAIIMPKGTGYFGAHISNSTTMYGDSRGTKAVDLQMERTASNQVAAATHSVITGGYANRTQGDFSVISGGNTNYMDSTGDYAFIGGGNGNQVLDPYSIICGGLNNTATLSHGFIGGGSSNTAGGGWCVIGGGNANIIAFGASYSAIAGGRDNEVKDDYGFIGGGRYNVTGTSGRYQVVCGGEFNSTNGAQSFIGGGELNSITSTSDRNVIVGGYLNFISAGEYSAILQGNGTTINKSYGVVVGGKNTVVSRYGEHATGYGMHSYAGDSGDVKLGFRAESTNTSNVEAYLNGVYSERFVLEEDSVYNIKLVISGATSSVGKYISGYENFHARRVGSTVYFTSQERVRTRSDLADWTLSADSANNSIKLEVTSGETAIYRWTATMYGTKVAY